MQAYSEALSRLLSRVTPLASERVSLRQASGRVLDEDLFADSDLPRFSYSAMDGYAFASSDFVEGPPWTFTVASECTAGGAVPRFRPHTACRIFTGAELPAGTDTVVPQEDVTRDGDRVILSSAPARAQFVRRQGADLARGALALGRGVRLNPAKVALLATLDKPAVLVTRKPRVTLLCTGNELRLPGDFHTPEANTIAECNSFFLAATAEHDGATVSVAPFVRDDIDEAESAVRSALATSDLVLSVGGVSVGDHDVMRQAFERAGVTIETWRVAIKPGKPVVIGYRGATHVLGLPGNPASCALTYLLFGAPLLRALAGDPEPLAQRIAMKVHVDEPFRRKPGREEFLRAKIVVQGAGSQRPLESWAHILPNQASGAVTSFAQADALIVVPAEREEITDGEILQVIRL